MSFLKIKYSTRKSRPRLHWFSPISHIKTAYQC